MEKRGEQENICSTTSAENFVELFAVMKQQTELMMEHKAIQTAQMNTTFKKALHWKNKLGSN